MSPYLGDASLLLNSLWNAVQAMPVLLHQRKEISIGLGCDTKKAGVQ